jgi:hypothetical protein
MRTFMEPFSACFLFFLFHCEGQSFPLKRGMTDHTYITWYQFITHISGNKSLLWSIEVPVDRTHPDEQHANILHMAIHFYGWCFK